MHTSYNFPTTDPIRTLREIVMTPPAQLANNVCKQDLQIRAALKYLEEGNSKWILQPDMQEAFLTFIRLQCDADEQGMSWSELVKQFAHSLGLFPVGKRIAWKGEQYDTFCRQHKIDTIFRGRKGMYVGLKGRTYQKK